MAIVNTQGPITKTQGPKDQSPNVILGPNMAITKTQGPITKTQG